MCALSVEIERYKPAVHQRERKKQAKYAIKATALSARIYTSRDDKATTGVAWLSENIYFILREVHIVLQRKRSFFFASARELHRQLIPPRKPPPLLDIKSSVAREKSTGTAVCI